jgi:hypothetical protein
MEGHRPEDDDPLVPPIAEGEDAGAGRGSIADGVKKALLAGVGALFLTEEGARRVARDWKLPKDVINFIGQQASGAKDEILRVFAAELRSFLESESVRREILKALSENAVEIRAEIRLRPVGEPGAPRPDVKASIRSRRVRKEKKK